MKKILLSLTVLLMAGTALAQVNFTFERTSNTEATVNVAKDGEPAAGITATISISGATEYKAATGQTYGGTTVADAVTPNSVLCINRNTSEGSHTNPNIYTLTVTNSSANAITFDQFRVSGVAMNSNGHYQPAQTPRKRFFKIGYGGNATDWTEKWICDHTHHSGSRVNNLFDLNDTQTIEAGEEYIFTISISKEGVAATNNWNQGCFWGITEVSLVNTHTLKVGTSGYATLMLGYNATIPAETTCYKAVANGTYATLTAIEEGTLAANTAVLVKAKAGDYVFEPVDYASAVEGNELRGTLSTKNIAPESGTTCYVLANKNGVGFYRAELNQNAAGADGETHFLNNANKAYLPARAVTASARFLSYYYGTETAIESIEAETATDAVVYDLAGRRVKAAQKGLYIVNGKVVIK